MLFQIEEPDGSPLDEGGGPGAFSDGAGPPAGRVAIAIGRNAEMLPGDPVPGQAVAPCAVSPSGRSAVR